MNDLSKKEQIEIGQEIEFYASLNNAWIENRMELAKSILTLSTLGIGLYVVLYKTIVENSLQAWSYFSIFSFVCSIVSILIALILNPHYLQICINKKTTNSNQSGEYLCKIINSSFYVAIIAFFLAIIATSYVYYKIT